MCTSGGDIRFIVGCWSVAMVIAGCWVVATVIAVCGVVATVIAGCGTLVKIIGALVAVIAGCGLGYTFSMSGGVVAVTLFFVAETTSWRGRVLLLICLLYTSPSPRDRG